MLREIISRVADGTPWTVEALARELDTTPELVTVMLEDLVRRGYLREVRGACGEGCGSCSMAQGCIKGMADRAWTVSGAHT